MRKSRLVLLVVWLGVVAVLGVYWMGSGTWVADHLPFMKVSADNRDTINVAPYIYGKTAPVSLGEIKNPENAYVHLKLRFRADSTEGYPNVFQTAPVNRGMRMEISGSTAAIVVPDLSVPAGLKGLTLSTDLKIGQWYVLEVEALNGSFIHATLDGHLVADYASASLSMETSQLLVGSGFDVSRAFHGQIDNISITKDNRPLLLYKSQGILFTFFSVLFVFLFFKQKNTVLIVAALLQILIIICLGDSLVGYPISKFLLGAGRFDDFYNTVIRAPQLPDIKDSYIVSPALIFLFRFVPLHYADQVFAFYNITCIFIIYCALRKLKIKPFIALALLMSYPVLFAISRGNAELLVFGIVLFSASYLVAEELKPAIILILIAATIKPTSLVFLALFPAKYLLKNWIFLALAFLANLLILVSINPNIWQFINSYLIMLGNYKKANVLGVGGDLFNNSVYGLVKTGIYYFYKDILDRKDLIETLADSYGIIANFILLVWILCIQLSRQFSIIIKIWFLAVAVTFLPAVSADYRLLYLLIPIALILIKENCTKIDNILFYGTLILIIPKHFISLHIQGAGVITLQSVANPLIFGCLLCALLVGLQKEPHR